MASPPDAKRIKVEAVEVEEKTEKIGNLTIEEANRFAENVTGYHFIDLQTESVSAKNHRKSLCMICLKTPDKWRDHSAKCHPMTSSESESSEVVEVMKRMCDVRHLRYFSNRCINYGMLSKLFPTIPYIPLVNFLTSLGFVFCGNGQKTGGKKRKNVDFEKKYEEETIRGVSRQKTMEIIGGFRREHLKFKEEFELFSDLVTSARMTDPSTQNNIFCYLCGKEVNTRNFSRHMKLHEDVKVGELFKRISEVQNELYVMAQPVGIGEIREICQKEEDLNQVVEFLMDAGFVVDYEKKESVRRKKRLVVFDPEMEEMPDLKVKEELEEEENEDTDSEFSDARSRESSVASDTSSASSTASSSSSRIVIRPCHSPADEPFPYCVLNAIPEHIEVEHALFDLLTAMTDDADFELDQAQYAFLLGYTTYCLVVGNGCRQNAVAKLTLGDYRSAKLDESSGLYYFSFTTKSPFNSTDTIEFVCADEKIWRAMEIFEVARERRAFRMNWEDATEDSAPFFTSFASPLPISQTTHCRMAQFLRMCGLDFACRSNAICSAAWSLVRRDSEKAAHWQYALTYFGMLREKELRQAQLVAGGVEEHATMQAIRCVNIQWRRREKKEKKKEEKEQKMNWRSERLLKRIGTEIEQKDDLGEEPIGERTFLERSRNPVKVELGEEPNAETKFLESARNLVKKELGEEPIAETKFLESARYLVKKELGEEPIAETKFLENTRDSSTVSDYRIEASGEKTLSCL